MVGVVKCKGWKFSETIQLPAVREVQIVSVVRVMRQTYRSKADRCTETETVMQGLLGFGSS